jgi:Spy/CpxP family protein refolding chaperone
MDAAKLTPLQAALEKAIQARKDKDSAALNALYAALEPEQRKAVVAAVRSKRAEREAHMQEKGAEGDKPAAADWNKKRLERMTKELDLDAGQQKKVEALLAKQEHPAPATMDTMREEMKKRTDALLTAFEGSGFDATKMELWPTPEKKPGDAADKHVQYLSQLIPILKPEQREKLATRMENPPMARGPRPGMQNNWTPGAGGWFDESESGGAAPGGALSGPPAGGPPAGGPPAGGPPAGGPRPSDPHP